MGITGLKNEERQERVDELAAEIISLCRTKTLSINDVVRACKAAGAKMWHMKQGQTLADLERIAQ